VTLRIVERAPVHVVCLHYTGPFGEPLARFWRVTVNPWLADLGLLDCPRYGVSLDNPMQTPPESCRYDACIELPAGLDLEDVERKVIAGGSYAVAPFRGTAADIGAAWDGLVGAVFTSGAWRLDASRPPFEHYPRGALQDARTGQFACELCLPLTN
jgi:AraC family transcriptional regulator